MKDKIQKIREEVARIQLYTQSEVLKQVLDYIDEVQKEPVSDIWHDASEPPIIDKTFLLIAPNGNSSLCLWGGKELHSVTIGGGHSVLCKGDIYSYIDDILNLSNVQRTLKNRKEPVSEELEEASKEWLSPQLDKSYAAYGETKQMELTHFDGYAMLDAIEFGAQWQKVKHERQFSFINLKDCKDAYNEWKGTQKEPVSAALSWVRACQWQKQQDQETIELAEDHAMFAGMEKMKEEMMTKSIEAVVSQVPCSNEIIFYNPSSVDKYYLPQEMNKLGLNKGDKVKLVIIKKD